MYKVRSVSDFVMTQGGKMYFKVFEERESDVFYTGYILYEELDSVEQQLLKDFEGVGINV